MAQTLLTPDMITREAVELWENSNAFVQRVDKQYDDQFARPGAKIGNSLRIRLPNDYIVSNGPALYAQDTRETYTTLTINSQKHVGLAFTSSERTMSIQDYSERFLAPAVNNLAGAAAADLMDTVLPCNLVFKNDGSGNILSPDLATWNNARAALATNSAPMDTWNIIAHPYSMSRTMSSLSGLFNPATAISKQYASGMVMNAVGFDWMQDQTVKVFTSGSAATATVSTAGQTGSNLTVSAISGTLVKGDIITIDGVNAVNRITKRTTGALRQFVVTADVASGATTIPIYPALVGPQPDGSQAQYQTVDALPAMSATVRNVVGASKSYIRNIAFQKKAFTMAFADLEMPGAGAEGSRVSEDNISMRFVNQYIIGSDQTGSRLDILYGIANIRPEWAVVVCDVIPS